MQDLLQLVCALQQGCWNPGPEAHKPAGIFPRSKAACTKATSKSGSVVCLVGQETRLDCSPQGLGSYSVLEK